MTKVNMYLNLIDVKQALAVDSYEYETLTNVMATMYDDMLKWEQKFIDVEMKSLPR